VVGGALPWTGYLVTAVRHARASRTRLVVWGWFVLGLAFLSAGESKLVTYALPLFPALAILAADAIVSAGGFVQRPGYAVYASSLAVLPAVAAGIISWRYDDVGVPYWFVTAAIGVAIAVVAVWIRTRGTLSAAPLWLPVMALCGLMILLPRGAAWMTGRDLAVTLNAGGALPPHVSVLDERIGSLVFYLSPSLRAAATPNRIDQASLAEAISRIRVSHPDAVIAVRHDRLARFNRLFASPPPPDARAGTFDVFRAATLQQALTIR
jgi:4-amino-4-deoxy-L-arabinose transferase-like glycosyltransferase